jgi:ABC-type lipoprotein export system ATPase subunit
MVKTEHISFEHPGGKELVFPDFSLEPGTHMVVTGNSGSGKTTLLHLLAGLQRPKTGQIDINGTLLREVSDAEMDRFRGRHIGMVYQKPYFIKSLSIGENFLFYRHIARAEQNPAEIRQVLERLHIGDKFYKKPYELSQGEQQRASIALAVFNKPSLILADEPTASLDDLNCADVMNLLLQESHELGAHLILASHDARVIPQFKNRISL